LFKVLKQEPKTERYIVQGSLHSISEGFQVKVYKVYFLIVENYLLICLSMWILGFRECEWNVNEMYLRDQIDVFLDWLAPLVSYHFKWFKIISIMYLIALDSISSIFSILILMTLGFTSSARLASMGNVSKMSVPWCPIPKTTSVFLGLR